MPAPDDGRHSFDPHTLEPIFLRVPGGDGAFAWRARVGPCVAHADGELPGFARDVPTRPPGPMARDVPATQWRSVAWFDDAQRGFACDADARGLRVRFDDRGTLAIGDDGVVALGDDVPAHASVEALLGVGAVLALAQRHCFALHAAGVRDARGRAFVLLGASGAGKSTSAALLGAQDGWARLADDIVPTSCAAGDVQVWPAHPQLKLEPRHWYRGAEPLRPAALLLLARDAALPAPTLRALDATAATVLLLRRTAGTRLFAPELLAEHLWFARSVAQAVPAFALTVPDDLAHLARNAARTAALLEAWQPT